MLTSDLVHVRRRGDVLSVIPLGDKVRERARDLAAVFLDLARAHVDAGATRGALLEAFDGVPIAAHERRLARGLMKLITDRCTFDEAEAEDAPAIRRDLFQQASAARREGASPFDREALVAAVAETRGATPENLERALYSDLSEAHRLTSVDTAGPDALVGSYEVGQVQAVLLRAISVTATVRTGSPAVYRELFRRLKFLRLLFRIERLAGNAPGYRLVIDGPFSLFESVTKYGLQLALAFPAIALCDDWALEAALRWGRDARPLRFPIRGHGPGSDVAMQRAALPDEVAALLAQLEATETPWRASISSIILDLPGVGVCVPDLELRHRETGDIVYLEVLGFWSRDAVWKRVELVGKGLTQPIVFAVSKRLRVSEAALPDEASARLYVYSRTMNARALLARVEQAAAGATPAPSGTRSSRRGTP